jgi:magnesium and cobalt transporter
LGSYRVKGLTDLEQFNAAFGTELPEDQAGTISGLICGHLGRVPKRGEAIEWPPLAFEVLRADAKVIHLLKVSRLPQGATDSTDAAGAAQGQASGS